MTYRILSNRKNKSATVLFTANTTLVATGNSAATPLAIDDEVLTGLQIDSAIHGCPDGTFARVTRGANTVLIINTTGFLDLAGTSAAIQLDSSANLSVQFTGSNPATLILNLKKIGRGSTEY